VNDPGERAPSDVRGEPSVPRSGGPGQGTGRGDGAVGGTSAFDAIAVRYDALFTDHPIARRLRQRVWLALEAALPPGGSVLDLGCGTGADAWYLASRGFPVLGLDPSPAMIAVARARSDGASTRRAGPSDAPGPRDAERARALGAALRPTPTPLDGTQGPPPRFVVGAVQELARFAVAEGTSGPFDAALSNFGALNAAGDLAAVGSALAELLRPGAPLVAVVMGPFCLWEAAAHLVRGDVRRARRRWRGRARADLGAGTFEVAYPSPRALAAALGPSFALRACHGLGLVLPPTWSGAAGWLGRRPSLLDAADRLDAALCALPLGRAAADHYVARFERRP